MSNFSEKTIVCEEVILSRVRMLKAYSSRISTFRTKSINSKLSSRALIKAVKRELIFSYKLSSCRMRGKTYCRKP